MPLRPLEGRVNGEMCGGILIKRGDAMEGTLANLFVQVIAGAIGGTGAGSALKDLSMGKAGDAISGAVGGGVIGQILMAVLGGVLLPTLPAPRPDWISAASSRIWSAAAWVARWSWPLLAPSATLWPSSRGSSGRRFVIVSTQASLRVADVG
jgi:hypothetical protein